MASAFMPINLSGLLHWGIARRKGKKTFPESEFGAIGRLWRTPLSPKRSTGRARPSLR